MQSGQEQLFQNLIQQDNLSQKDRNRIAHNLLNDKNFKQYLVGLISQLSVTQEPSDEFSVQKAYWTECAGKRLLETIAYEAQAHSKDMEKVKNLDKE